MIRKLLVGLLGVVMVMPAVADEESPDRSWKMLFAAGMLTGGDAIVPLQITRLDANNQVIGVIKDDISAGEGYEVKVGAQFSLGDSFFLRGTAGLIWDSSRYYNTNPDKYVKHNFAHYPLEGVLFYRNGKHAFGGGVGYHVGSALTYSGENYNYRVTFKSTPGAVVEYDYFAAKNFYVALRYITQSFEANGDSGDGAVYAGDKFSGNSGAFQLGFLF